MITTKELKEQLSDMIGKVGTRHEMRKSYLIEIHHELIELRKKKKKKVQNGK